MGIADRPFAFLGLIIIDGRALKWLKRISGQAGNEKGKRSLQRSKVTSQQIVAKVGAQ
jgi:hypothetical protein